MRKVTLPSTWEHAEKIFWSGLRENRILSIIHDVLPMYTLVFNDCLQVVEMLRNPVCTSASVNKKNIYYAVHKLNPGMYCTKYACLML